MVSTTWRRFTSHLMRGRRRGSHGSRSNHTRLNLETLDDRRMLAAGVLDPGFGTNGQVLTDFFTSNDSALAMAIQDDGKIVVGGQTDSGGGGTNFALARYLADGTLDTSFSFDGKVATDFAGEYDFVMDLAIQPDGKIIAAGSAVNGPKSDFALARYNTDGSLDTSFGTGGKVLTDFAGDIDFAQGVAIQPDGKIVAVGTTGNGQDWALVRYNEDGSLNADFDADGKVILDVGTTQEFAFDVAIQADGKIVAAGSAGSGADRDFAVARFNSDGTPDAGFATGGSTRTDFFGGQDAARSVVIQADGKIVAAGSAASDAGNEIALARYTTEGWLDSDFDADGKVATDVAGGSDLGRAVTVQADGKIIAAGQTSSGGGSTNFAVVRYIQDGTVDSSFSVDGKVITDFAGGEDIGQAVAVQSDGAIVVAGSAFNGTDSDVGLARYLGDAPQALATVESIVVGDGSLQRSMVNSLSVTFSAVVDLDTDSFELVREGFGAIAFQIGTATVDGKTVATLSFDGPDVFGGTLPDGNYTLTVHGGAVHDALGRQLDGDGDGTAGGDRVEAFFRLFGDSDGDGDGDKADRSLFSDSFGTVAGDPLFLAFFDFDGDGDIDRHDRKEFNKRFRKK